MRGIERFRGKVKLSNTAFEADESSQQEHKINSFSPAKLSQIKQNVKSIIEKHRHLVQAKPPPQRNIVRLKPTTTEGSQLFESKLKESPSVVIIKRHKHKKPSTGETLLT